MPILILTDSGSPDRSIGAVCRHLEAAGRPLLRLDTRRFPVDTCLSLDGEGGVSWEGAPLLPSAVWSRHTDIGAGVRDRLHPDWADQCCFQAELAFWNAVCELPGLHVDHPYRLRRLPTLVGMLRLARACGLEVPRTLISNDPAQIRSFVAGCRDGAIRKLPHSSSLQIAGGDSGDSGDVRYGRTDMVTAEDLADDDRLRACPLIWQERLLKAREYRVTAVGRGLFSASVDPRGSIAGATDWRQDPALVRAFRPDPLPAPAEAAIQRLMDRLGIEFATIDLIRTPDDRIVFLEVNTTSFFDFIEDSTGLPISRAVADLLSGQAPTRSGRRAGAEREECG